MIAPFNPELDLEINRLLKAPVAKVWRCWAEPELLKQWWTPKPVVIRHAEIDLRPGGRFHWVMELPDGNIQTMDFCMLDVQPEGRIVFTDALLAGYRPAEKPMFGFTGYISMKPEAGGTRYIARAIHGRRDSAMQHDDMGFQDGWGSVTTQLEMLAGELQ